MINDYGLPAKPDLLDHCHSRIRDHRHDASVQKQLGLAASDQGGYELKAEEFAQSRGIERFITNLLQNGHFLSAISGFSF